MKAFTGPAVVEPPAASNRRQPVRQTRTNSTRMASNAQPQGGALVQLTDVERNANPGFYPAIQHFTDAIAALPKEMIRHYTMLKEVDAKIYGPEALLGELVTQALKAPPPPRTNPSIPKASHSTKQSAIPASDGPSTAADSADASRLDMSTRPETQEQADAIDWARRKHFHSIRQTMADMLVTLDEKNHVLNTALDGLDKQMKRCNSSYPHIEDEISEEARYGSLTHWAYTEKTAEKKGIMAGERTRRAANAAAANAAAQEAEGAAIRSEQRREALAAKKNRNHNLDSDFDDGRATSKKTQAGSKGRKAADAALGNSLGLGIANGVPPSKRRKVEKLVGSNLGPERAMATVFGSSRGGAGSPRDLSVNDAPGKRKGRGGLALNGNGRRRSGFTSCGVNLLLTERNYRGNTNASAANSPSLASSPVVGTFSAAKDRQGRSPAPHPLQRMPSSRARQNSSNSVLQLPRNRSSSTNHHKATNGHGLYGTTADIDKVSSLTGRSTGDVKSNMRETGNARGEHLIEEIGTGDGAADLRGGLVVGSRNTDRALKREESVNGNGRTRPPSISISTRGGNGKQPSKTATPISASFTEPQRTRAPREIPQKRSHKKGAGLAAQIIAANQAHEDEASSIQGDDDEDLDEERYCYCNGVSYGEMVGCDGDECQREWFHLHCVGLAKAPARNAKWYCDECKENLKDSKFSRGNGR